MRAYKILLIDDDVFTLKGIGVNLKRNGYDVASTASGQEAIELLEENTFDLVLTDLVMEPIDGIQILVKAKKLNPQTKVIIISGYGVQKTIFDVFKFRADDFLLKPMDIEEIMGRVKQCLAAPHNPKPIGKREGALEGDARFSTALLATVPPE